MKLTKHQKWILESIKNGDRCYCDHVVNGRFGYEPFIKSKTNSEKVFKEIRLKDITINKMDEMGLFIWHSVYSNGHLCGWTLGLTDLSIKVLL